MNSGYLMTCADRIRTIAKKRIFALLPYQAEQIREDAETIMRELRLAGWHLLIAKYFGGGLQRC